MAAAADQLSPLLSSRSDIGHDGQGTERSQQSQKRVSETRAGDVSGNGRELEPAIRALQGEAWFAATHSPSKKSGTPRAPDVELDSWLGSNGWDRSTVDDVFGACDC